MFYLEDGRRKIEDEAESMSTAQVVSNISNIFINN
jgi:hypothetical protein